MLAESAHIDYFSALGGDFMLQEVICKNLQMIGESKCGSISASITNNRCIVRYNGRRVGCWSACSNEYKYTMSDAVINTILEDITSYA